MIGGQHRKPRNNLTNKRIVVKDTMQQRMALRKTSISKHERTCQNSTYKKKTVYRHAYTLPDSEQHIAQLSETFLATV